MLAMSESFGKSWTKRYGGKEKEFIVTFSGMIGNFALIARRWPLPALRVWRLD